MPREKKQKLKKRPDGRYQCQYKDHYFYSYISSDDALAQRTLYKQMEQEQEQEQAHEEMTVRQYAEKWITRAHPDIAPSTLAQLKIHLRKFLDVCGDTPLAKVNPSQIKAVYSNRYKGLSSSYINAGKQLITALFDAVVADGYRHSNPAAEKAAKPHKGTKGSHRQITPQEREWIQTLCTDHRAHAAVMTMLWTGIRPQEMKAVDLDRDVDLKNDLLTLHQFAHLDGSNHYRITDKGKTDKATRSIPIFPPLHQTLSGKSGPLIANADGSPLTIQGWKCVWASYVASMETAINGCQKHWYGRTKKHKAILASGKELPPWIPFTVVPYDLRHSFCCWCRDAKPPVEMNTCIKWMGHTDAKMILKIYDEVSNERSQKEYERLLKTEFPCLEACQTETSNAEAVEI